MPGRISFGSSAAFTIITSAPPTRISSGTIAYHSISGRAEGLDLGEHARERRHSPASGSPSEGAVKLGTWVSMCSRRRSTEGSIRSSIGFG